MAKLPVPISKKSCPVNLHWLYLSLIVADVPCAGAVALVSNGDIWNVISIFGDVPLVAVTLTTL